MDFFTREVFDALIVGVILVGLSLAFLRLRADFTRPLADDFAADDDDTRPSGSPGEDDHADIP